MKSNEKPKGGLKARLEAQAQQSKTRPVAATHEMRGDRAPNFGERMLFLFSPDKGNRRFLERVKREREAGNGEIGGERMRMAASGYGNHGASTTLNSMVGWIVGGGSAEDDIDLHGATLR